MSIKILNLVLVLCIMPSNTMQNYDGLRSAHYSTKAKGYSNRLSQSEQHTFVQTVPAASCVVVYNSYYNPIFLHAAADGKLGILKLIDCTGIDVNIRDKNGNSALMLAAQNNHVDVVKWLLMNKANAFYENEKKLTALNMAQASNAKEVVAILADGL